MQRNRLYGSHDPLPMLAQHCACATLTLTPSRLEGRFSNIHPATLLQRFKLVLILQIQICREAHTNNTCCGAPTQSDPPTINILQTTPEDSTLTRPHLPHLGIVGRKVSRAGRKTRQQQSEHKISEKRITSKHSCKTPDKTVMEHILPRPHAPIPSDKEPKETNVKEISIFSNTPKENALGR